MPHTGLIREIVRQACDRAGRDAGGWVVLSIPGVPPQELAAAIHEAYDRGLILACDVSSDESPYEWWVSGATLAGKEFLRAERHSVLLHRLIWGVALAVLILVGWLAQRLIPWW